MFVFVLIVFFDLFLVECIVMGILSIFTNFSGFGCFMQEYINDFKFYGFYIVDRRYKSLDELIYQLIQVTMGIKYGMIFVIFFFLQYVSFFYFI